MVKSKSVSCTHNIYLSDKRELSKPPIPLKLLLEGLQKVQENTRAIHETFFLHSHNYLQLCRHSLLTLLVLQNLQSFAYDGKTVIVAATLSDIKKAEQGKGDMDSKKLVRVPSKVSKRDHSP